MRSRARVSLPICHLPGNSHLATGLNSKRVPSRPRAQSCVNGRRRSMQGSAGFHNEMAARFGSERIGTEVPLAPYTTFKVGGPAEWFFEARAASEIVDALRLARASRVNVTVLGGGSNVLIGDRGVRGLVIRPRGGQVEQIDRERVRADAAVTINGLVRWTVQRG